MIDNRSQKAVKVAAKFMAAAKALEEDEQAARAAKAASSKAEAAVEEYEKALAEEYEKAAARAERRMSRESLKAKAAEEAGFDFRALIEMEHKLEAAAEKAARFAEQAAD